MSWFDEQIRQRKQCDREAFEDSLFEMASAITGNRGNKRINEERLITKGAIDDILKFYRFKPADIPSSAESREEQLEYALRPYGIMYRSVELSGEWYKDAVGPMMVYTKDGGTPTALIPGALGGYSCTDGANRKIRINKKNAERFEADALCFYRPLPLHSLKIRDFIKFLVSCVNMSDLVILLVFTVIMTLLGMMMPYITKMLTGFVFYAGSVSMLAAAAAFAFCVSVSSYMTKIANQLAISRINIKASVTVEAAVIMRLISLPPSFFRQYSSGELSRRVQSVNQLCALIAGSILSVGLTSAASLLYIIQIFQFTPSLAQAAIAITALTALIILAAALKRVRLAKKILENDAKEDGLTYSIINGIQKIKLAGAEKRIFAKWADEYSKNAKLTYNPPLFLKIQNTLILAVSLAGTLILYCLAVDSGVSPSEYIAFNAAYGVIIGTFTSFGGVITSVAQIRPVLDMIEPILKEEPETSEKMEIITSTSGDIELNNVYFRYSEKMPYIVNGMDLKIRPGEYTAIVGKTGCGKSTLLRLLLGFEKPEKGAVYYGGKDISKVDLRSLRRMIGVVTQDGGLFQGDIYSNIVISDPSLTLDRAWEAAETAGIADDIRAMPMGMHTIISEGNGGISGGQKQRIMIARAIAPRPKILMFDEATSALDNKTQKQVSESLDKLKCTRIVIAHRLSTVKNCDRILVLDGGKIAEDGTYDELLEKKGIFAELVERQRLEV